MRYMIMKTNNGTHSVEDWAAVTAAQIIPIDDALQGGRLLAAQKLQIAVTEALIPHHQKHHERELSGLASGDDHYDTPLHATPDAVDAAIGDIVKASVGMPWESHFADKAVQEAIHHEIQVMFSTHSDVERQHHADRHPHLPKALAYKQFRHPVAA